MLKDEILKQVENDHVLQVNFPLYGVSFRFKKQHKGVYSIIKKFCIYDGKHSRILGYYKTAFGCICHLLGVLLPPHYN